MQVKPNHDILPIRAHFGEENVWDIGLCYVTSDRPLWFALPDVITSRVFTNESPKILKAIRFKPVGLQNGPVDIEIVGNIRISKDDDLIQKLVECRRIKKSQRDKFTKDAPEYEHVRIGSSPSNLSILLSDQIEGKGLMAYAVPLVTVAVQNDSFVVPLSTRLVNLNSSDFRVTYTGQYVMVRLRLVHVEYSVNIRRISQESYDQMNNSQFEYFSLYRDAEIYYALAAMEYKNITTVSMSGMEGMATFNAKTVYAVKNTSAVLIETRIEGETVKMDNTGVITIDYEFTQLLARDFDIARIATSYHPRIEEPPIPFTFVA